MENSKQRWYSILFMICLGLLITSIPFGLFIKNSYLVIILNIITKIAAIIFVLVYLKKEKIGEIRLTKPKKRDLVFSPFILLSFTNFIVIFANQEIMNIKIDYKSIILNFGFCLLTAVFEEILFRFVLIKEFHKTNNNLLTIIYSAISFGAIHLLNIGSISSILPSLAQVAYTAFLGLILGLIYLFTNNLIYPIVLHFCFNFFNNTLVTALYPLKWNLNFFLINIAIGILIFIYAYIIFKFFDKKEDLYATKNLDF